MSFHVGQKVALAAHKPGEWIVVSGGEIPLHIPRIGEVYTISGIELDENESWLLFDEIPGPYSFEASRFRPLVERKTDISVFTAMLKRWEVPA